jgi:hypothetical protein
MCCLLSYALEAAGRIYLCQVLPWVENISTLDDNFNVNQF